MTRPKKNRCCQEYAGDRIIKPRGIPFSRLQQVCLGLDELEAMRLCDLERCGQEETGRQMEVSRGTVYRLVKSGRAKILEAILESKALIIEQEQDTSNEAD